MEKNEILQMIDTLTNSLDLLVDTQRKTQEFMQTQLDVNKMLIQRVNKLEVEANVVKTDEPYSGIDILDGPVVENVFQNMIERFNKERDEHK